MSERRGALATYVAPVSEFTTPGDLQRERIASALGWDPQGALGRASSGTDDHAMADPRGIVNQGIGFGAGIIDPWGLNAMLARRFGGDTGAQVAGLLNYAQQQAPAAHAMGSAIVPTIGAGRALGLTAREALHPGWWGNGMVLSGALRHLYDTFRDAGGGWENYSNRWDAARRLGIMPTASAQQRQRMLDAMDGEIDTERP